jgi:hypothetical protein
MAKTLVHTVMEQLQSERARLQNELHRVSAALTAFGNVYFKGSKTKSAAPRRRRTMSAAGRRRIAAAQKARWAKVRAGKLKARKTRTSKA